MKIKQRLAKDASGLPPPCGEGWGGDLHRPSTCLDPIRPTDVQKNRRLLQYFFAAHPATPSHSCFNSLVPQRLHQQACWRCGAGAGVKGKTQNLHLRVRGKWSPSGDTGEMAGDGFQPVVSSPNWRVRRACVAHMGNGVGKVCRVKSAGSPGADRFQQTFPAAIPGRETEVAGKNR